jgi:hypothetical protein
MMQNRFRPILWTPLVAAVLWVFFNASSSTVVLAQQPTVSPTPEGIQPTGIFITVITEEPQINVRMGPSSAIYPVVGILLRGATAPALGRSPGGDWIQIEFPGAPDGKGWVYSPLVEVSPPGTLQIIEPPPTPVPPPTSTIDPTFAAQFTVIPTSTRLPTFTPPPSLSVPVYTDSPASHSSNPIPMAVVIIFLGVAGLFVFLFSLFTRR